MKTTGMKWVQTATGWTQVSTSAKPAPKAAPVVSVNDLLREALKNASDNDPTCGLLKRALAA